MAEFALPQAVQYDNTANQMLYNMANDLRQQKKLEQQYKKEDDARKYQLLSQLNPDALNKDYDKQVVNGSIAGLQGNVKNYLTQNPNANSTELQAYIQGEVSKVAQWSNKVSTIRKNIDDQFSRMEKTDGIDKNGWYAKALNDALYKKVNGQFVFKGPDELDPAQDWVGESFKSGSDMLVNMDQAGKLLNTGIKDAPMQKQVVSTKKRDASGRTIIEETTVDIPAYMTVSKDKEGNDKVVVKKDKDGYISTEAYDYFVQKGSPIDLFLNNKAKSIIAQANKDKSIKSQIGIDAVDVEDPGNMELIKRAWLTNHVQALAPFKYQDKQADMQKSVNVTVKTGADKDVPVIDLYGSIQDAVKNGTKVRVGGKPVGTPLNSLDQGQDYVIEMANKVGGKDENGQPKYNQTNLILKETNNGGIGIFEWDANTSTAGRLVSPLNKTKTNVTANQPLGTKSKSKAVEQTKSISKADVAKKASAAGYTVEEYTKELQKRGIKII